MEDVLRRAWYERVTPSMPCWAYPKGVGKPRRVSLSNGTIMLPTECAP